MNCVICNNKNFIYDKNISAKCTKCDILYNLQTEELNYSDGGGQDIPTEEKSKIRVKNALKRFEIIVPHKTTHNIFVDIGCGSGEMLEASKNFFDFHLGYDENKVLINHTKNSGLNTFNKYFEKEDLAKLSSGGGGGSFYKSCIRTCERTNKYA